MDDLQALAAFRSFRNKLAFGYSQNFLQTGWYRRRYDEKLKNLHAAILAVVRVAIKYRIRMAGSRRRWLERGGQDRALYVAENDKGATLLLSALVAEYV